MSETGRALGPLQDMSSEMKQTFDHARTNKKRHPRAMHVYA